MSMELGNPADRALLLAGLQRAVEDFEREREQMGSSSDAISIAELFVASWPEPHTQRDVMQCAIAIDRSRKRPGAGRTPNPALDYLRDRARDLRDGGLSWKAVATLLAVEIAEREEPEHFIDGLGLDDNATDKALAKLASMTEQQIEVALRR